MKKVIFLCLTILIGITTIIFITTCSNNVFFGIGSTPDMIPPTISITSHSNNQVVYDKIKFGGKTEDDIVVRSVKIYLVETVNNKIVEKEIGSADVNNYEKKWEILLDTVKFEDGPNVFKVKAFDGKGNQGVTSITLVIDNFGPYVLINKPENKETDIYYQEFLTAISCIDVTKTTYIEWQIQLEQYPNVFISGNVTPPQPFEKDFSFTINPVALSKSNVGFSKGYGILKIRGKNERGKFSRRWYEKRIYFDFSNSVPQIMIISPEETERLQAKRVGTDITIMGQVTDNTGVKEIKIRLTKPDDTTADFTINYNPPYQKVMFFSYGFTGLGSGIHSVQAMAIDTDDLVSAWTEKHYFNVDTSYPTIVITEPEAGSWLRGNVTLRANVSIAAPDVIKKVEKKINNGSWQEVSTPNSSTYNLEDTLNTPVLFPNGGDGIYYIRATAGEVSDPTGDKVTEASILFNVDNYLPQGNITTPPDGNSGLNQTILIEGTATDYIGATLEPGIVKSVSLMIGSFGPFTPIGLSSWSYQFPSDQPPYNIGMTGNQPVNLVVTITDNAGNSYTLPPRVLNINQLADVPQVTLDNLSNNQKIYGLYTLMGTAADDDAVQKVQIKIDNGSWIDAVGTTQWAYNLLCSDYSNGPHTLYYRSVDINGKTSEYTPGGSVKSINFEIDPDVPIVQITSHNNNDAVKGTITISGTVTKTQGYVASVKAKWEGVLNQSYIDIGSIPGATISGIGTLNVTYSFPINTTGTDGNLVVTVRAEDDMSRSNEVARDLVVDNTRPTADFTSPTNNLLYRGKDQWNNPIPLTISGTCSDPIPSSGLLLSYIVVNFIYNPDSTTVNVIDGVTTGKIALGSIANWYYDWNPANSVKDGLYKAELLVHDRSGNIPVSTIERTNIRLARFTPTASNFRINGTPVTPNMYIIQNSTFEGTILDNDGNDLVKGVKRLEMYLSDDTEVNAGDTNFKNIDYTGNNDSETFNFTQDFTGMRKDYIIYRMIDKVGGWTDYVLRVNIDNTPPSQDFKYTSVGFQPSTVSTNPGTSASLWVKLDVTDTIDGTTPAPMDGSTIRAKLGTTPGGDEILIEEIYTVGDYLKADLKGISGNVYLWYRVVDKAGNVKQETITLTRDSNLPSISFTQPQGVFLRNATRTISGTSTGGGQTIASVKVTSVDPTGSINSHTFYNATGTTNWSYTIPTPSEGDHTIKALVTANDGTNWYETLNFTYDNTVPTTTFTVVEIPNSNQGRVRGNNLSGIVRFQGVWSDNFGIRHSSSDVGITLNIDGANINVPDVNKTKNADGTFNWYYDWDSQTHSTYNVVKNNIAISVTVTDKAGNSSVVNISGGNKNVVPYILSIDHEVGKIVPVIGFDGSNWYNLNDNKTYTYRLSGGNITIRGLNLNSTNNETIYYNTTESPLPSPSNYWTITSGNMNTITFNLSGSMSGGNPPSTTCYLYIKVAGTNTIDSNAKKIIMIRNYAANNYLSMGYMDMVVGDDNNARVVYVKNYNNQPAYSLGSRCLSSGYSLDPNGYGIYRFKESGESIFTPDAHQIADILMHSHNIFWFLNINKDIGTPSQTDGKYYIFTCDSENVNDCTWGTQIFGHRYFWYDSETGTTPNLPSVYMLRWPRIWGPANDWGASGPGTTQPTGGSDGKGYGAYRNRWRMSAPNNGITYYNYHSNETDFPKDNAPYMADWSAKWGDNVAKNDITYSVWFSEYNNKLYYRRLNNLSSNSTKSPASGAIVFNIKGMYPSIALDSSNRPVIACFDETNGDLIVYWAQNTDPQNEAQWTKYVVDSSGVVGLYPRIWINGSDIHLAYQDLTNASLKYTYTTNPANLPSATKIVLDTEAAPGYFIDLQMTPNGKPSITYISWGYLATGNAIKTIRFTASDSDFTNRTKWEKITLPCERNILASNPGGMPNKVRGYVRGSSGFGWLFAFGKSDRPEFFREKP
ncbi:MAG TPA: Ig-like domain-containing protein [Spirochaetota bacterium]|nr:Ig-like domain-containing protein [Spirochaetota bacterium]